MEQTDKRLHFIQDTFPEIRNENTFPRSNNIWETKFYKNDEIHLVDETI